MTSHLHNLSEKANKLPLNPGIYIMKDSAGVIIYIGKAKKLKNRVSQYFRRESSHTVKVLEMVSRVFDFEYIVTDTEFEALVLECSLIKKYKPKYNILLKDDKGYYYIKITNDTWPRIKSAKIKSKDKAKYIGPYTSIGFVTQVLNNTLKIFKLPSCERKFNLRSIGNIPKRACLNYYIGQCSGPCIGKISIEDYLESVRQAELFLTRGSGKIIKHLKSKMETAAKNLEFEKAAKIRDQILTLKKLNSNKQKVILSNEKSDFDVLALAVHRASEKFTLSVFKIFNYCAGKLSDSSEYIFKNMLNEPQSARSDFIGQYYYDKTKIPQKILLDGPTDYKEILEEWLSSKKGKKVEILIPKNGEPLKILKMCQNNANEILQHKLKLEVNLNTENKNLLVLEELKQILNLSSLPEHIEAFDVSNLRDSNVVSGMVVFREGHPDKKLYKRFKIKTFIGQDDYHAMREVITRRFEEYKKSLNGSEKNGFHILPDLILLDGGKGHVSVVKSALQMLSINVPIFGMVKDKTHRTKALTNEYREFNLDKDSNPYKFIYKIQEEVHRYSINYNKILRNKNLRFSQLTDIPGVGEVLSKNLLEHFKTIENIKKAKIEDIEKVKGISKRLAVSIFSYFRNS